MTDMVDIVRRGVRHKDFNKIKLVSDEHHSFVRRVQDGGDISPRRNNLTRYNLSSTPNSFGFEARFLGSL